MHSPGKLAQVGMVENVHSTRMKREFCKPAIKSDRNTTPEKNFVTEMTRDGDDILNLKPPSVLQISTVQMCKIPSKVAGHLFRQEESGRYLCFFLVCVLEHVR